VPGMTAQKKLIFQKLSPSPRPRVSSRHPAT
jgi:hypothetical protein